MNTRNVFLIITLIISTQSLYPKPSIELPTVVHITGIEPINVALDKTNLALDKINVAINKFSCIPHGRGIMMLGRYVCYLGVQ